MTQSYIWKLQKNLTHSSEGVIVEWGIFQPYHGENKWDVRFVLDQHAELEF